MIFNIYIIRVLIRLVRWSHYNLIYYGVLFFVCVTPHYTDIIPYKIVQYLKLAKIDYFLLMRDNRKNI